MLTCFNMIYYMMLTRSILYVIVYYIMLTLIWKCFFQFFQIIQKCSNFQFFNVFNVSENIQFPDFQAAGRRKLTILAETENFRLNKKSDENGATFFQFFQFFELFKSFSIFSIFSISPKIFSFRIFGPPAGGNWKCQKDKCPNLKLNIFRNSQIWKIERMRTITHFQRRNRFFVVTYWHLIVKSTISYEHMSKSLKKWCAYRPALKN